MTQQNLKDLETIKDHYTYEAQSRQAIEEMAELIQAINKKWRKDGKGYLLDHKHDNDDFDEHIAEEIADVTICLEQIIMLLGIEERVDRWIDAKIERTLSRMKKEGLI